MIELASYFLTLLHGLALNLIFDQKMFDEVKRIHPCGLDPETYVCANQLLIEAISPQEFGEYFIKTVV